jgi:hypothetical protein
VTDRWSTIASRYSGNMFEQMPVFLFGIWLYTLFVDYESGGNLGLLYIASRLLYPLYYMVNREFSMWFEMVTQIGYGVCGIFIVGSLYVAAGWDWMSFGNDSPTLAALLGFTIGSFGIFPGLPLGPLYFYLHFKFDRMEKNQIDKRS